MDNKEVIKSIVKKFEAFESTLNGEASSDFHKQRKNALNRFSEIGLPIGKSEEYKYTNISKPLVNNFINKLGITTIGNTERIKDLVDFSLDANIIIILNGIFQSELSKIVSSESEIEIKKVKEASESDIVERLEDGFDLLNNSFANEGVFISVKKSKHVEKPVVIYFISDSEENECLVQPKNIYHIAENAEVQIVESYKVVGEKGSFTNVSTQIKVEKNARVQHARLQIELGNSYHVGNTNVSQEVGSVFTNTTVSFSGKMVRNNLNIAIEDSHSEANMYGLFVLDGDHHVDNHTVVDHKKAHSVSNELYKGILDEQSEGVFNGKIFVRQDAQKTNAFQSNNNILLSDKATINTKPQLEIWADDVKCSHGATTGQLDESQQFYLRSRGYSKEQARAVLLNAFAMEVIEKIKIEPLKEFLTKKLEEQLNTTIS